MRGSRVFPSRCGIRQSAIRLPGPRKFTAALSGTIRRYSISPVAIGFCFLVRRELITQHGLFDDVFAPGYFEEFDFCLRMNEFGYSSIIANRAMVFHAGARSFAEQSLLRCFPAHERYSLSAIHSSGELWRHTCSSTAILSMCSLTHSYQRMRFGACSWTSMRSRPPDYRKIRSCCLRRLQKASDPNRLVASVSIPDDQRDNIAAQYPALQVIHHSRLDRLWDVAVASGDTVSRTQLIRLNRVSPRWVFTSTGIGAVRMWRKRAANSSIKALAQDAIGHADGIIALRTGVTAELEMYTRQRNRAFSCRWYRRTRRHRCRRHRGEIVERYGRRQSTSNAYARDGTTLPATSASRLSVVSFDGPICSPGTDWHCT